MVHYLSSHVDVSIFVSALWLIAGPAHIYGLAKWRQFRNHFLIAKQFPLIVYGLAVVANLRHLASIILSWFYFGLDAQHPDSIVNFHFLEALDYISLSLVLYRTLLVLLRFRRQREISNDDENDLKREELVSYHITFGVATGLGCAAILMLEQYECLAYAAWTAIFFLGFVIVGASKLQAVAEDLGIEMVAHFSLLTMLITFCVYRVESVHHNETLTHVMRYLHELCASVWCLLPVYVTLRNVRLSQGTLNVVTARRQKRSASLMDIPRDIGVAAPGCSVKLDVSLLAQPLYLFLENEHNHRVLSAYLRHCFAIENMLFIERVAIFKETILQMTQPGTPAMPTIDEQEEADPDLPETPLRPRIVSVSSPVVIPRIKLSFLTSVYAQIRALIGIDDDDAVWPATEDFEQHRAGLHAAATMICDTHVRENSSVEINVSYGMRMGIVQRLSNDRSFENFDDYAELFDEAFIDIFRLVMSIYGYRFKAWCLR